MDKQDQIKKLRKSGQIIINEQGKSELILPEGIKIGETIEQKVNLTYKVSDIIYYDSQSKRENRKIKEGAVELSYIKNNSEYTNNMSRFTSYKNNGSKRKTLSKI